MAQTGAEQGGAELLQHPQHPGSAAFGRNSPLQEQNPRFCEHCRVWQISYWGDFSCFFLLKEGFPPSFKIHDFKRRISCPVRPVCSPCTALVWKLLSGDFYECDFQIHSPGIQTQGSASDLEEKQPRIRCPRANPAGLWGHRAELAGGAFTINQLLGSHGSCFGQGGRTTQTQLV